MPQTLRKHIQLFSQTVSDEHGSILPYVSVAAAIVAFVALGLMTGLGDAILHRRDASNAADAAALAAAQAWANSVESTYGHARDTTDEGGFWNNAGRGLGAFAGPGAERAAEHYASLHGSTVTSYMVDGSRGTVTVSVQTISTIANTNQRATATSTAKIVAENGACIHNGKIGLKVGQKCMTKHSEISASDKRPQNDRAIHDDQKVKFSTRLIP